MVSFACGLLMAQRYRHRCIEFTVGIGGTADIDGMSLSRDNLDENGGGNQSLKRRPVASL